jgi:hypothetical protein
MKKRSVILAGALAIGFAIGPAGVSEAAIPPQQEISICQNLFGGVFGSPNSEPFAPCQWDMAIMNAGTASYARATGQGVKVGVIDSGVQTNHPDIAPNLNLALSCSFLTPGTPTAAPGEIPGPAGCANRPRWRTSPVTARMSPRPSLLRSTASASPVSLRGRRSWP